MRIRVKANTADRRAECRVENIAHYGDARDIKIGRATDLDLDRAAAASHCFASELLGLFGRKLRDDRVDLDEFAYRLRPALECGLDRRGKPASGCLRRVVGKRSELPPAGRTLDEHALADIDAAKCATQWQRERHGSIEKPLQVPIDHGRLGN